MIETLTGFPFAEAKPDTTAVSAIEAVSNAFALFGAPGLITADRGTCFTSLKFKEYCVNNKITLNLLPSYQPEWAGSVEKLNHTLRYSITKSSFDDIDMWDTHLNKILFGLRARVHSRTGYSPYFLFFGIDPSLPVPGVTSEKLQDSLKSRKIEATHLAALRFQTERPRKESSKVQKFKVNDLVMILNEGLRKKRKTASKITKRYTGPHRIIETNAHNMYNVESEKSKKIEVHASRLKAYSSRFPGTSLGAGELWSSSA
ncbi:Pro-Pol polyprotein [Smittium culicis]|uniref:Pro-Pol polyprotein n=1 Tax=Smittium culicis TaxID=133412 RepID=A0A1R1YPX1_9FUNG|nr:Pro-Pol polyprotein [Smittium culicis]